MNDKIKLFHITRDFKEPISVFKPRVPSSRMGTEDSTTPRICVSPTIKGCILGHPNIVQFLNAYDEEPIYTVEETMAEQQYSLVHGISGILCRVYEFEVDASIVKTSTELVSESLVPDAHITNEHWILEEVKPVSMHFIIIKKANILFFTENGIVDEVEVEYQSFEIKELGIVMSVMEYLSYDEYLNLKFPKRQPLEIVFSEKDIGEFALHIISKKEPAEEIFQ